MNRNTSALVALAALAALAVTFGAAGSVAAADTEVNNATVEVTNDTSGVYADATAVAIYNGATPPNVSVTVEGLPNGTAVGNGTVLLNETRTLQSGSVESYEYTLSDSDRANYTQVHISISSSGNGSLIDSTDLGSIGRISAGGGGSLGAGGLGSTGIIGVLAVVGLLVYMRD